MNAFLNRVTGLGFAAWLCWFFALGALVLAFPGPERSGALMAHPLALGLTAVFASLLLLNGIRAVRRRRFDSVLLHVGCTCVLAGWLVGRCAERASTPEHPVTGAMAMADGEVSDTLWEGPNLTNYVGRVPFSVRLERFFVERYDRNEQDRDAGRDAPVREYRSRVTINEPGKAPYVRNIRVNHPAYVQGYHIYQMSWGQGADRYGRPVEYTVLQFIRDPGLPLVYAGFVVLFAGVLAFAVRIFRMKVPEPKEVLS